MTEMPPQWAEMKARAIELRRAGRSYEEIVEQVSSDRCGTTPWAVYKWCNPEKTGDQIRAWMQKHHPDPDEWTFQYLAKHHPDAQRRLEEANARELAYLRRKGL